MSGAPFLDMSRWQARLEELAHERGVPGASLAVLSGGRIHTAVTGVVNVETGVAVTPETLFAIGSITKLFTATAVMRLVERGALGLEAPILDVVPELRLADPAATAAVTARHLLTHTSGIAGDALIDTGPGDDALARFVARLAELDLDLPLGITYSYSNAGFALLGLVIERLTGASWDMAMRTLVLDPIGMTRTTSVASDLVRHRATCGHVGARGALRLEPRAAGRASMRSMSPAGATTYATATDVAEFAQLFLRGGVARDGSRVLSQAAVVEMLRPQVDVPALRPGTEMNGLGWYMLTWGGRRVLKHDGGTIGHRAVVEVVPDRDVAFVVLANGRNDIAKPLLAELHSALCDLERPVTPRLTTPLKAADVDLLAGRYVRCGIELVLEGRDDGLWAAETTLEPLASLLGESKPRALDVRPSGLGAGAYVCRERGHDDWESLVLSEIGGERYLHRGGRGHRRVG